MAFPAPIQKLIDLFAKFPTVGPRTAARFVFYLTKMPQNEVDNLINAVASLKKSVKNCAFCANPFEASSVEEDALCPICKNPARDRTMLCIVEKESDLISIENIKKYKGLYFILGGVFPGLKMAEKAEEKMKEIEARVKNPEKFGINNSGFKEIIIATNPTTEGVATGLYIERKLKEIIAAENPITISRLARGLPTGGELEYADEETLESAFEGRK